MRDRDAVPEIEGEGLVTGLFVSPQRKKRVVERKR